ncbi:tRNA pseudouridine65 synthase [Thiothrix eikelboomii]|uniref:tRNA pseudouridine65 synthase n=1 Tax=Thiothrix eikelboomii TaxID=92487 RepID=A0A1T4W5J2_9GAMM|nr:tRNA pseudouridine(65) synthase TruC [Thiothrix eikelboomii]SKA72540.1 tRNA pseudouridine65 synthase [Thiothrix eikelboomii]
MSPLEILYQDEFLVAINKPSGLLVHRSLIDKHETRFAVQLLRDQIGQKVYPPHRLDRPTSGVLLFALDPNIARLLTEQFTQAALEKTYLALVRGFCAAEAVIDYPLKEVLDEIADAQAAQDKPAQTAITQYRRLEQFELPLASGKHLTSRYSLLELQPKTGRKHQLRRHLKHIFHPIVGDTTHGDGKQNQLFREQFGCERLLLHAQTLSFLHPVNKVTLRLQAPLAEEFVQVLQAVASNNLLVGDLDVCS